MLDLVPVEEMSRDVVETEPILAYYRSEREPRLLVIDKANGGKADALNAALNHARYRYVCGVDADMVFARDALSRAMRTLSRDPATIVGLTSYVEIAEDPSRALVGGVEYDIPESKPLVAYQTLDYLRAFFNNRIAWSRLDFMLCAIGAFQVWRRDLLDELGGWARGFTCEDIELTFRVHKVLRERRVPYRVVCIPDRVGVTEGPNTVRKLVAQRERWQRVILETWWAYRHMCFRRRYGSVGLLGMPFYLPLRGHRSCLRAHCDRDAVRRCRRRVRGLVALLLRLPRDHAGQRLPQRRRASPGRPPGTGLPCARDPPAVRPDALRASGLPAGNDLGAHPGHVAVPAGRSGMAQVRAKRAHGGGLTGPTTARTREDALLLAVALASAVVAVVALRQAAPMELGLWLAAAAALGLALAALFALWFGGAARGVVRETLFGDWSAARTVLSTIPDGLFLVEDGRLRSVNRQLCELLGFDREELLGASAPFPFWPPEYRHEIEAWHATLDASGAADRELTLRRRDGERLRVLVAGRTVIDGAARRHHLVTVRDVSHGHRREQRLAELASRDPDTGLINQRELEQRLAEAVRRALATGGNVTVVLASLSLGGKRATAGCAVPRRSSPSIGSRRRCARGTCSAAPPTASSRGSCPTRICTVASVPSRVRTELASLDGVALTVGICDLVTAGTGSRSTHSPGARSTPRCVAARAPVQYASRALAA